MPKSKRDPAAELRSVPPRRFVAARRALAARLTGQGDRDEARRVAKLPRPSPVTWALNRAAAARPRELTTLADAVDRLRRAQLGQGDLRAATEGYRTAFEPLVRAARDALEGADTKATAALDRRLRSTLLAAVADRKLRADLAGGRLETEHADPGFSALSAGPVRAVLRRGRPLRERRENRGDRTAAVERASDGRHGEPRDSEPARPSQPDRRAARRQAREAGRREQAVRKAERAAQAAERRVLAMRERLAALEQHSAALRDAADRARGDAR